MQPGIWLFEVSAPGYLPETVALPIRILTTVSMGTSGMSLVWDLVLKPLKAPDDVSGALLNQAVAAMREAKPDEARAALRLIPDTADADFLAGGGRIAMLAGDRALAKTLFTSALGVDPSSYRAALGVASVFVLERDFDSASRAFDAARSRTHDKDEQNSSAPRSATSRPSRSGNLSLSHQPSAIDDEHQAFLPFVRTRPENPSGRRRQSGPRLQERRCHAALHPPRVPAPGSRTSTATVRSTT